MTPKIKQKPFQTDDLMIEYLETDISFRQTRKQSFYQIQKQFQTENNNNIFMTIKQQYINFAHLIGKNAIVATIIMLIALTTVGASATELLAPEEFKPSTQIQNIFASNKQPEKEPYTALKPDENNDVVISDTCDLAIKYPKKINEQKVISYNLEAIGRTEITDNLKMRDDIKIAHENEFKYITEIANAPEFNNKFMSEMAQNILAGFNITCYDAKTEEFRHEDLFRDVIFGEIYDKETADENAKKEVEHSLAQEYKDMPDYQPISRNIVYKNEQAKNKINELTGWFINQADLQELTLYELKNQLMSADVLLDNENLLRERAYRYSIKGGRYYFTVDQYKIAFLYKDKYYTIQFSQLSETQKELPKVQKDKIETYDKGIVETETTNIQQIAKGIFGNQVQLQFNSLVKNEASTEILKEIEEDVAEKNPKEFENQPLVAD